jgi:hypothetical protein
MIPVDAVAEAGDVREARGRPWKQGGVAPSWLLWL